MPGDSTVSLQEIHRRRQQDEFVGRVDQLAFFAQNLSYSPEDDRRRFVVGISGQGGVGKTFLLGRFRQLAISAQAVVGWAGELEDSVPAVMSRLSDDFAQQGHELKTFSERYRVYRQRRQELEADPDAPGGTARLVGRTIARAGVMLVKQAPLGELLADQLDQKEIANQAGEWATYAARKFTNKDEVRLLLEPDEVLTPLFIQDIQRIAKQRTVVLFLDNYEITGQFCDAWLRRLLEGSFGPLPSNIVIGIAGRDELDQNYWSAYSDLMYTISLDAFSEEEATEYLVKHGIHDERLVSSILEMSNKLPLLVAVLAAGRPTGVTTLEEPSGPAVERFLRWVSDPQRKNAALSAALPRRLDRDVLSTILSGDIDSAFAWLRTMPFVQERPDGWVYHSIVRTQMLRYRRRESFQQWRLAHEKLASYFQDYIRVSRDDEKYSFNDETQLKHMLEMVYHRLCCDRREYLDEAVELFLYVLEHRRPLVSQWLEMVRQAGDESESDSVRRLGATLALLVRHEELEEYEEAASLYTKLLESNRLAGEAAEVALVRRASCLLFSGDASRALTDLEQIISTNPRHKRARVVRSVLRFYTGNLTGAISDLSNLVEDYPEDKYLPILLEFVTSLSRGPMSFLRFMLRDTRLENVSDNIIEKSYLSNESKMLDSRKHSKAIDALIDAVVSQLSLSPHVGGNSLVNFIEVARSIGLPSMEDLDESQRGMLESVGRSYVEGDFAKAIDLLNELLDKNPEIDSIRLLRVNFWMRLGKSGNILEDLEHIYRRHPENHALLEIVESTRRIITESANILPSRDDDAVTEMYDSFGGFLRGFVCLMAGNYASAFAEFDCAVAREGDTNENLCARGVARKLLGDNVGAATDFRVAIERSMSKHDDDERDVVNLVNLGLYHLLLGENEAALNWYRQAVDIAREEPDLHCAGILHGQQDLGLLLSLDLMETEAPIMLALLSQSDISPGGSQETDGRQ